MSLLTITDAARLSGIPASTWRRWISEGRITAVYRDRRAWLRPQDAAQLAAWRSARRYLH